MFLCASLPLLLLFWQWRPMPVIVWNIQEPDMAMATGGPVNLFTLWKPEASGSQRGRNTFDVCENGDEPAQILFGVRRAT